MSIPRQLLTLSIWPLIENVLNFLATATALFVASHMGKSASDSVALTDAMGATGYVAWFGLVLQGAVATGGTAIIARLTGANEAKNASHACAQCILLGLFAGIFSCLIVQATLPLMLGKFIILSPQAYEYAYSYMQLVALSYPISGMVLAATASLRGSGDTKTPFKVMLLVDVVNAALAWLLALGPEPFGGWGVKGLAFAMLGGYGSGLLFIFFIFVKKHRVAASSGPQLGELAPAWRDLKVDRGMLARIMRIGVPQAVEIFGVFAIHFYVISIISKLQTAGSLGAHIIAVRTESMSFMPGFAIGSAVAALVGQYLGAGAPEQARKAILQALKWGASLMGTIGIVFMIFAEHFVTIFASRTPELAEMAAPLIRICGATEAFFAVCIVFKFALRGAGYTRQVMLASYAVMGFFRIVVISILAHYFTLDLKIIWIVFGVDLIVQSVVFWRMFKSGKWMGIQV